MRNLPQCASCKYGCERCHAPLNQYQNAILYILLCRWVERNAKKMNVAPQVGLTCFYQWNNTDSCRAEVTHLHKNGDVKVRFPPKSQGNTVKMKGQPKEQAFRLRVLAEDVARGRLFEEPSYLSNQYKDEIARRLDIWSSAMVRDSSHARAPRQIHF